MQVLMHTNCTHSSTNIYASVGSNSVTFIECQYNDYLFRDLWDRLCFYYDKTHPTQPKKLSELPEEFNSWLDNYIETQTSFVAELPLVQGEDGKLNTSANFQ